MLKNVILIVFTLLTTYGIGQDVFTDKNLDDHEIAKQCKKYCDSCITTGNNLAALDYIGHALKAIKNNGTRDYWTLRFLLGRSYYYTGETHKSKEVLIQTKNTAEENSWNELESNCRRFLAFCDLGLGEISSALDYLEKNKEAPIDSSSYYMALSDLGIVHYNAGNFQKCVNHWLPYLAYCERSENLQEYTSVLGNLGLVYIELKDFKNAEQYLLHSRKISDSLGFTKLKINALNNLGKLEFERKNYKKAEEYMLKSIEDYKNKGLSVDLVNGYSNIGEIFLKNGAYKTGKNYLDKALSLSKLLSDPKVEASLMRNLSEYYFLVEDYKNSHMYLDSAYSLKDSILNEEKIKALTEVETKYRVKQKDDSIRMATQETRFAEMEKRDAELQVKAEKLTNANRKTQIIGLMAILAIAALMLIIIFRRNGVIKEQNKQLEHQKNVIETKNKDITDSILYAKNLQRAILPDVDIIRESIPKYVLYYEPRDIVSGDFYWFHETEDKVIVAAADCTGHGVPGAFVSMLCNDALNKTIVTLGEEDPGIILSKVNETVIDAFRKEKATFQANDGMDIALCVLDKSKTYLKFAGAMNRMLLVRNNALIEYKGDKRAIGGKTEIDFEFKTQRIELNPKDCIYMFSDGYIDQFGGVMHGSKQGGKKFMMKRFKKLILDIHQEKAEEQKDLLKNTFEEWKGNLEQLDDVLVIGFEI